MNSVNLTGRIGSINYYPEKRCTVLSIAVNDYYKGTQQTDWIKVMTNGTLAENTNKYCSKGDLISVTGKLKTSEYYNKKIQATIRDFFVSCRTIEFLESKTAKAVRQMGVSVEE